MSPYRAGGQEPGPLQTEAAMAAARRELAQLAGEPIGVIETRPISFVVRCPRCARLHHVAGDKLGRTVALPCGQRVRARSKLEEARATAEDVLAPSVFAVRKARRRRT